MIVLGTWLERLKQRTCLYEEEGAQGGLLGGKGEGQQGGQQEGDWRTGLPEDIRDEPSLASIKTVPDLAKGYVHAQKLVGADKIAKPSDKWTPDQWSEFWNQVGRPETSDGYKFGEFKLAEGVQIQDDRLKTARAKFHELGLTNAQADGVMQYYVGVVNGETENAQKAQVQSRQTAIDSLTKEHGDKTQEVIDVAIGAMKKLGGDELTKAITEAGFDNSVPLINFLHKVGSMLQEDHARGQGDGLIIPDQSAAKQRINELTQDTQFMLRLNNRTLMDKKSGDILVTREQHQEALDEWNRLHQIAYKGDA